MTTESHGPENARNKPGLGLLDALVEAERASMEPPADGERQTWKRVVASVAAGGPAPVQPSSVTGPTASVMAPWIKTVLGVVLSGVVAMAGYRLGSDPDPEPEPAATTAARASAGQPAVVAAPPAPEPPEPPPDVVPPVAPPPKTVPATPPEAAAPPASDLAEETRLLARARARLRSGSPSDALAPLTEHARRFPHGQLTEDRMVLRAQALCKSDNTEAGRKEASALRKAFPKSSHLPRVDRACNP